MNDAIRVLLVPPGIEEPARVVTIPADPTTLLRELQKLVGGFIEGVSGFGDWVAYVDEEGKLKMSPTNPRATVLAHVHGWPKGDIICGPAVFLGRNGPEETSVPEWIVATCDDIEADMGIVP